MDGMTINHIVSIDHGSHNCTKLYIPSASRTHKFVGLFPKKRFFFSYEKNSFFLQKYGLFSLLGKNLLFLTLGVMTSHDPFFWRIQCPLLIIALDLSLTVPFMLIILPPRWLLLAVLTRKDPVLLEHVGQH